MTTAKLWRLRAYGTPQPKGSMKCVGGRGPAKHQLVEDDKTGERKVWRTTLTDAARILAAHLDAPIDAPVTVGMLAIAPRKPSVRAPLPTTRSSGDVDKLLRMVLDAITDAGVLRDDSRVILAPAAKVYATPDRFPGAIVYVSLGGLDAAMRILQAMGDEAPELHY